MEHSYKFTRSGLIILFYRLGNWGLKKKKNGIAKVMWYFKGNMIWELMVLCISVKPDPTPESSISTDDL